MSDFLIFIQINDINSITYGNAIADWAKEHLKDLNVLDLDNYSEIFIVEKAIEVMRKGKRILIVVDANPDTVETGFITKVLNVFLRLQTAKKEVIFIGENDLIKKMAGSLGSGRFHLQPEMPDVMNIMKRFFSAKA